MSDNSLTYKGSGVDYDAMDPFKRQCQLVAIETKKNIERFGIEEITWSRGESAYVMQSPAGFIAHVEEGLGTKNLVADAMYKLTGKSYFDVVAQDAVAMIVNDIITVGVLPVSLCMHLAVGNSDWFKDEIRSNDLINGWKNACNLSRCAWGGGETPTLKDIIIGDTAVISGSGIGFAKKLFQPHIQDNDAIILIESSGIHANGLTAIREMSRNLENGYLTKLPDDKIFGEEILKPTHIYVGAIEDLQNAGIDIHYAVNITGHGWRKLMRSNDEFTYRITTLPEDHYLFNFIKVHGPMSDEEAYGNLNMGEGFALYISDKDVGATLNLINNGSYGFKARHAGHIIKGEKKVVIEPKGITFKKDTLSVR